RSQINQLTLRLQYDDGFVAYINGVAVASRNAPGDVFSNPLNWDAAATAYHPDTAAIQFETLNLSSSVGALVNGINVLAIQGLNTSSTNSDFLIRAEITAASVGQRSSTPRYFVVPTPGAINGPGTADSGPI